VCGFQTYLTFFLIIILYVHVNLFLMLFILYHTRICNFWTRCCTTILNGCHQRTCWQIKRLVRMQ